MTMKLYTVFIIAVTDRSLCYGFGSNQRSSLLYAILFGNLWATNVERTCRSNRVIWGDYHTMEGLVTQPPASFCMNEMS
jgi:hypothetical protein